jgi:hypothetical protein
MDNVSTRSPVYMRSQGVLTGQSFSISDNEISLLPQETHTCNELLVHETYNLIHCSYYWQLRSFR